MSGGSHGPLRFLTVGDVPGYFAARELAEEAPILSDGRRAVTWRDIDQNSSRMAGALQNSGLQPGNKMGVLLPNCSEYVEILFAVAKVGLTIVPLSGRSPAAEVKRALEFAEAKALVTASQYQDVTASALEDLPSIPPTAVWTIDEGPWAAYGEAIESKPERFTPIEIDEESTFWMPFTSGTTGTPKAPMVSHRALVEHWRIAIHEFDLSRKDRMLIAAPFYHSLGFIMGLSALFAGGRLVIHREFEPAAVLRTIEQESVTVTPLVPTMCAMLITASERGDHDYSSLRAVISAGSPLITSTKEAILDLFPDTDLYELYASTEMGIVSVLGPKDQRRKVGSVGLPALGTSLRLLDDAGQEVPLGKPGEIHKRGALLAAKYFKNPVATKAADHDGWFASGDIGRFDEDGYLWVVDRKTDMIVTGGANVFPTEIEEVISRHDAVLEVAVIGVPDESWGESVTAVIVPRPGRTVSPDEILTLCSQELAHYKKPQQIEFVSELPKSDTGKILKRKLRDAYLKEHHVRVQ